MRRREIDAGAARLGQADGDRLFRGPRTVLALAHVVDLLAHELAGLRGGGLALAFVATGPLERLLLWHAAPPRTDRSERYASDYAFLSAYETARPAPASAWMPYGGIG